MIGNSAFYFKAYGCAGRAKCNLSFKEGSEAQFDIHNTLLNYDIEYSTDICGTTLIAYININPKVVSCVYIMWNLCSYVALCVIVEVSYVELIQASMQLECTD